MQKTIVTRKDAESESRVLVLLPFEADYKDKILAYLIKSLGRKITISSISEDLGLSYGSLHYAVQKLLAEKIINAEEVGNYKLLSLNLKNTLAIAELSRVSVRIAQEMINQNKKLKKLPKLVERLRKYKEILSIVLFGSHAKLQARESSDIDLLVILSETSENPGQFISVEKTKKLRTRALVNEIRADIRAFAVTEFLEIQHFVVDYEMFARMLQSKEEINVGKEALKDGIILDGYENYWKMVGEIHG